MCLHILIIRANTPKEDWANNIFAGIAFFLLDDKEQGIECVELNVDFDYEREISKALLEEMRKGNLNSLEDIVRSFQLGDLS